MNNAIGKIIIFVPIVLVAVIAIVAIFFLPSAESEGTVTYDNKEGTITIDFTNPLPEASWTAYVYYETSSSSGGWDRHTVLDDEPVVMSSDNKTGKITDEKLVNLNDFTYYIEISAPSQSAHTLHFDATGHIYSTGEIVTIVLVILFFVIIVGFLVVRRILFGGKMSWSWSWQKRI